MISDKVNTNARIKDIKPEIFPLLNAVNIAVANALNDININPLDAIRNHQTVIAYVSIFDITQP